MDGRPFLPPEVLAQYDLGKVHALEPKAGGGIDESFVVTSASGRCFFKRRSTDYSPDIVEMVGCDHALVEFLVSEGGVAFTGQAFDPNNGAWMG